MYNYDLHFYESVLELPLHLLNDAYERWVVLLNECDPAHDEKHLMHTCLNAYKIMEQFSLSDRERLIVLYSAYVHDIGNIWNRTKHETIGADEISGYLSFSKPKVFSGVEIKSIAGCISHHRASYTGTYSNRLEEIVAMADRGVPDLDVAYWRSYLFARNYYNLEHEEALHHSFYHVTDEKWGWNGYGWNSGLVKRYYPIESSEFLETIAHEIVKGQKVYVAEYSDRWLKRYERR